MMRGIGYILYLEFPEWTIYMLNLSDNLPGPDRRHQGFGNL